MELKHISERRFHVLRRLLIVPYGIETEFLVRVEELHFLLIVPYGIETESG